MTALVSFLLFASCWLGTSPMSADSDMNLTTPEMISKHGYPVETHTVVSDGYFLVLHRIPRGKDSPADGTTGPPVLLHHALLCSSFDWVVLGPQQSLGFILADAGYDVWLANARGNTYSREHEKLEPEDPMFWDFSWHEMGKMDVPAEIDYILNATAQDKLHYVGHSMGTTMFFVMASERPEYNDKVRVMIAFAPVALFSPTSNPLLHYAQRFAEGFLEKTFRFLGVHEFLPETSMLNPISRVICREGAFTQDFCIDFIFMIVGRSTQVDKSRLPVMLAHNPAGASTREVMHFAQEALSGDFRQFDFGSEENLQVYGQETPPVYDLKKISAPVAMYYSSNDKLAPAYNVMKVAGLLPNVILKHKVPLRTFNHLDFMWGKDAHRLLYKDVLKILEHY